MEQNVSWDAQNHLVGNEIIGFLWNTRGYNRAQHTCHTLDQINPVYIITPYPL
jgi:hypothetical protein